MEPLNIGRDAEVLVILAQLLVQPHIPVSSQMTGIHNVYKLARRMERGNRKAGRAC